jgi:translation initiation factor IF-2
LKDKLAEVSVPEQAASLDLGDAVKAETINTILRNAKIRSALFPFVNEAQERSKEEVDQLVQSQQFQQRLQVIHVALERDVLTFITEALECGKGEIQGKKIPILFYYVSYSLLLDIKSFLKAVEEQAKIEEHSETDAMDED